MSEAYQALLIQATLIVIGPFGPRVFRPVAISFWKDACQ